METEQVKKPIPSPQERPDLYDDYDGGQATEGKNPVKTPDYIQKLIAERKGRSQAPKQ
jgi:hypothetical protein